MLILAALVSWYSEVNCEPSQEILYIYLYAHLHICVCVCVYKKNHMHPPPVAHAVNWQREEGRTAAKGEAV